MRTNYKSSSSLKLELYLILLPETFSGGMVALWSEQPSSTVFLENSLSFSALDFLFNGKTGLSPFYL